MPSNAHFVMYETINEVVVDELKHVSPQKQIRADHIFVNVKHRRTHLYYVKQCL